MDAFDFALAILWPEEGGLANNPSDHGGLTMLGVTQRTYDTYRYLVGLPLRAVTLLQKEEASNLYHVLFWMPAYCANLPKRLACMQFDTAVNSGTREAIVLLQRAIGTTVDGQWGPSTLAAVQFPDSSIEDGAIIAYGTARKDFMAMLAQRDPTQEQFIKGWYNRVDALVKKLLVEEAA